MMRHEAAEDVLRENSSMYEELLSNIPSWVYRLRIQAYGALISSVAAFVSYLTLFGEFVEVGVLIKKLRCKSDSHQHANQSDCEAF
jgi:hypothetical protein